MSDKARTEVYLAKITVTLRRSILDVQGKAVQHAIESLGMKQVRDIRMGKYIEMQVDTPDAAAAERVAEEACRKLLANPVMEDFSCRVEKE